MRRVQLGRVAAFAFLAGVVAEPALAQQKVSVTVAAGQPARAIPGLALISEFEDLEIVGNVLLLLHVSSTNTDTDFFVRVADQFPQAPEERAQGRQPASVMVAKGGSAPRSLVHSRQPAADRAR